MSHGETSKTGSHPHEIFKRDTKSKFQSYGYRVRNRLYHMGKYSKMDAPPHQIFMWDTK